MFCCLYTNQLFTYEIIPKHFKLCTTETLAYQSHLFETIKAANTGIKQLNFINMPKCTYESVFNTLFHAFLAFGSISKHFHLINRSPGTVDLVLPRWINSKVPCF